MSGGWIQQLVFIKLPSLISEPSEVLIVSHPHWTDREQLRTGMARSQQVPDVAWTRCEPPFCCTLHRKEVAQRCPFPPSPRTQLASVEVSNAPSH